MARAWRLPAPHPAQRERRPAQRAAAQTSSRRLLSTVREPGQLCLPQLSRLLHKGKFSVAAQNLGATQKVYLKKAQRCLCAWKPRHATRFDGISFVTH